MSSRRRERRGPKGPRSATNMSMKNLLTKTERLAFRDVTTIQRSATVGYEISEIDLTIASFSATSRVRALAQFYEFFRFKKLDVKAICDVTGIMDYETSTGGVAAGVSHGLGFIPSAAADFKTATSYDDLMQYPNADLATGSQTLRLTMSPSQLYQSTPTKWYHTTNQGSPPSADLSAGVVSYITRFGSAPDGGISYSYVVLEGVIEFKASLIGTASLSTQLPSLYGIGEQVDRSEDDLSETQETSSVKNMPNSRAGSTLEKRAPAAKSRGKGIALK